LSVIQFFFQVSAAADLQSLSGPAGWDIVYAKGGTIVDWESPDSTTDLAPGQTGVFAFKSALDSTPQPYTIFGIDEVNFDLGSNSGQIASPAQQVSAAVPEPASLTLLGIGAAALAGYSGWRLRRRPAVAPQQ
jgi:hypothetical protein